MRTEQKATALQRIRTVCHLCPNQDGIVATVQNGRITDLEGDREHPLTRGYICLKARHAWETIYHPQRFKHPLLRTKSGWEAISWEEALDIAADRLGELRNKFGPLSFCSANCGSNRPEQIALSLFTRSLGSHGQTVAGIRRLRDAGIPTNVHVVILRQNYRELPTLVDHLIGLGCTLKFSFPVFSGGARHNAADIACRVSEAIPHLQEAVARLEATQTDYFVAKAQVCAWPERFAHVIQQVSDISDHRHFPCCDGCHYRERCDGISATYAALYGTDEFRAISGPVPRPASLRRRRS